MDLSLNHFSWPLKKHDSSEAMSDLPPVSLQQLGHLTKLQVTGTAASKQKRARKTIVKDGPISATRKRGRTSGPQKVESQVTAQTGQGTYVFGSIFPIDELEGAEVLQSTRVGSG